MKKLLTSLTLCLLAISTTFAAKARPGITHLSLTDGSVVSAILHGDENFHYYKMTDGTPLQEVSNGKYQAIPLKVLEANRAKVMMARRTRAASIGSDSPNYFPHKGSPKALVILVQFQDVKFKSSDPIATFEHYLNGKIGEAAPVADQSIFITDEEHQYYGSVLQYFADMSDNQFTPQFDIVGPVTVSQNSAYYGRNRGADGNDANYTKMMAEACKLADDKVNFADYDSDNDGYVDLVYFIYAGYSESISGNSADCLWPKSGTASICTCDNKTICRFGINNELNETPSDTPTGKYYLNGIGLFCHEFSHTMGVPDLYPTDSSLSSATADNQSPEYWDLMDMGEYTDNGYRPTPYTPWEKSIMGWKQPITLSDNTAQQIELTPYDQSSTAYKIEANSNGEYLLLQNIRNEGWFKALPGYGLLIWRIDYADMANVNLFDNPNNDSGAPRVMIVPADGKVINIANVNNGTYQYYEYETSLQNDPFPAYGIGTNGGDINSLTSVKLNHNTLTSRPLYNIVKDEATGIVTFDYLKDFAATGIEQAIVKKEDNSSTEYYNLEGKKIETPQKGHLYITNKGKKILFQ